MCLSWFFWFFEWTLHLDPQIFILFITNSTDIEGVVANMFQTYEISKSDQVEFIIHNDNCNCFAQLIFLMKLDEDTPLNIIF